jgi:hypothetical protein
MLAANYNMKTMSEQLTHLDEHGRARMVDVGHKENTVRVATARGRVQMCKCSRRRSSRLWPVI